MCRIVYSVLFVSFCLVASLKRTVSYSGGNSMMYCVCVLEENYLIFCMNLIVSVNFFVSNTHEGIQSDAVPELVTVVIVVCIV